MNYKALRLARVGSISSQESTVLYTIAHLDRVSYSGSWVLEEQYVVQRVNSSTFESLTTGM